jgi:hypothetical protein
MSVVRLCIRYTIFIVSRAVFLSVGRGFLFNFTGLYILSTPMIDRTRLFECFWAQGQITTEKGMKLCSYMYSMLIVEFFILEDFFLFLSVFSKFFQM